MRIIDGNFYAACGAQYLSPLVEKFVSKSSSVPDEEVVLDFIRKTTMVGVLPVPHPIITRRCDPDLHTVAMHLAL